MHFKMICETKQTKKAAPLFDGWQESLIWSCLEGVMGRLYVDSVEDPASAMITLGLQGCDHRPAG